MFYFLFFTQYYFQNFLEKDFWNFLPKSLENSIGIISQNSIPTILNPWTVLVWQHWRMYGLSVWRIKSPAGIFSHIHIRASGCESPIQKRKPRRPCQGFLRKYCYEIMKKILYYFLIFYFCLFFIFSLVYSHDFNLNSYRLPVRDFNLNPPLAIAKGILLCHHQILNPASLLLQ